MSASTKKWSKSVHRGQVATKRRESTGLCINCGNRLTLCGRPFTADVKCIKCNHINHFEMSQQPTSSHPMDVDGYSKELS